MQNQAFELGQSVSYIRHRGAEALEGTGVIRAILLDHMGRKVVQLFDASQPANQQVFNCDFNSINPSEDYKARFRELVVFVNLKTHQGNEEAAKVVARFNHEIETAVTALVGEPMDLSVFKAAPALDQPANDLAA